MKKKYVGEFELLCNEKLCREIVGIIAKFLIAKSNWDYKGKISPAILKNKTFSHHANVIDVFDGFNSVGTEEMDSDKSIIIFAKKVSEYSFTKSLISGKAKKSVRLRKLSKLKKVLPKTLNRAYQRKKPYCSSNPPCGSGVRYSITSIKKQFL